MSTPKISVIMPVYNSAAYLDDCLNSLHDQTYRNIEIICVNDGSSDQSGRILRKHRDQDPRLTIITQENHGPGAARNRGLDVAQGDYLFFVDSDVILHRQALSLFLDTACSHAVDIVCGKSAPINAPSVQDEETLSGIFNFNTKPFDCFTARSIRIPMAVWNKLYHRRLIQNKRFISDVYYEDVPFTLSTFSDATSCALTQDKTYLYRTGNISIMRSGITVKKINDYTRILTAVHQDLCRKNKKEEAQLLFQNYFFRMNRMIFRELADNPHLQRYFLDKLRPLNKTGLLPSLSPCTCRIISHHYPIPKTGSHLLSEPHVR